jgi:hypothetical protein
MRVRAGSDCGRVVGTHSDGRAAGVGRSRPPASEQTSPRASATVVRVEDRSGFDWAAAGIGAHGGVALSVLSADLALLISERRERHREPKER